MKMKLIATALALGSLSLMAQAQSPTPQTQTAPATPEAMSKFRASCAADVQKFCAMVERGKGQIGKCLVSHTADLSDACKAAVAERASKQKI